MNTPKFPQRRATWLAATMLAIVLGTHAQDAAPASPAPQATPAAPAERGDRGDRGNRNTFQRGAEMQRGGFGNMNLDDKQRQLLQEARQSVEADLRKLNEKLAEAQKEYVHAVVGEKYDEATVRAKADAIGKIQADILALNGKAFATVAPSLRAEQREALESNSRFAIMIISPQGGFTPGGAVGGFTGRGGFGGPGGGDAATVGGRGGRGPGGPGGDAGGGNDRPPRRRDGGNPPPQ